MSDLESFDGRDVRAASIRVTHAGDGLSAALAVAPVEYHVGQRVTVALECVVDKVTYQPIPKSDDLERVHTFRADAGTIIDSTTIDRELRKSRDRIDRWREEQDGVVRLPGTTPPEPDD